MLPFIFVTIIKTVNTNPGAFEATIKHSDISPTNKCKFPDLKTIKVN